MFKFINFILSILFIILFSSCETDFNPNAEYKDIAVVYGLLNQNDSITYIKVNKAFLGEMNAYTMAQYEDSSSYGNNLEVKMEEIVNGAVVNLFVFDTTTIYNKEAGIFYAPKQILYKYNTYKQLNQRSEYRLTIRNKKTGKLITSSTNLINKFSIESPDQNAPYIDFSTNGKKKFMWNSAINGKRYQVRMRFNYYEDGLPKFIDFIFPVQKSAKTDGSEVMTTEYTGAMFYQTLKSNLAVVPGMVRVAGKIEVVITVAAEEISTYIDVNAPSGSIVQIRPEYTNISNGIGIFSARYDNSIERPRKLDLNAKSLDSLKYGQYTNMLGF